jgi:GNAT superfamily N-acetyltransferase
MKIIEYFDTPDKEYWLSKIAESDWDAGQYLAYLLKEEKLIALIGDGKVLMLTDGNDLVSFCTLAKYDDVQPTDLTPWIGFLYTFPKHRGKRFAGQLIAFAERTAEQDGAKYVYISTNHIGLYEKYGYEFYSFTNDVEGEETRVYRKKL